MAAHLELCRCEHVQRVDSDNVAVRPDHPRDGVAPPFRWGCRGLTVVETVND
jgi:hypothetical protein